MADTLADHDALVRGAIGRAGGHVFSTAGDGFAAAFATAGAAAAAAISIQAELVAADSPLRVRIGLNTGETDERGGDYFGPTLNRAGRLRDIAHGGQALCSELTARLLAEGVQPMELIDLGEHRLRDLSRVERVWQLGASPRFGPLRSVSNLPGNLPPQLTEFVGREAELLRLHDALESARIMTLTGVGGAGKTRLGIQFAAAVQSRFRDGVWLVDLAPLTSADAVGPLVASVTGIELVVDTDWVDAIVGAWRNRQLLLLLDNCEHVLDAAATVTAAVAHACPDVVVVATSREGLGVPGELIVPVGSLAVPHDSDQPEIARTSDAVRLFVSRARDLREFPDDDQTVIAVTNVCRRLDGIPLAIELAAARTQSMSVLEIERHLDDRFQLLTRGARSALNRHQTLRAAIDWSFDLLSDDERRVLTRASVFAGGFTLDAAASVCDVGNLSTIETLDNIDALVRQSLIIPEEAGTTTRYRMLETIRQYGAEQLEAGDTAVETSNIHLAWCTAFAEEVAEHARGRDDAAWLERMERELDNIRTALHFAAAVGDLNAAKTLLASVPVGAIWDSRLGAAMAALAVSIAPVIGEPEHPVTAAILTLRALEAAVRFAGDEAVELAERACRVARRHNDWLRTGPWLAWFFSVLIAERNETTMAIAEEAFARATDDDDKFAIAEWHAELGIAHWLAGETQAAEQWTQLGLTLAEAIGADNLVMRNAFLRGTSLLDPESEPAAAFPYFERAMRLGARVGGNVLFGGAAWAMLLSPRGTTGMTAAAFARELAAHLPTPMFLVDADGLVVFYNDAATPLVGRSFADLGEIRAEEFARALDLRTTSGEPLRRSHSAAGIAYVHRRPAHQTLLATGYDGRRHTVETTAYPLLSTNGEPQGVITVFWERTGLDNRD